MEKLYWSKVSIYSVMDNLILAAFKLLLSKSCEDLFGTSSYGFDSSNSSNCSKTIHKSYFYLFP